MAAPDRTIYANHLKILGPTLAMLMLLPGINSPAALVLFEDNFKGKLAEGWTWVRENTNAWRMTSSALEVLIEPGNMWGPANNAKNVLLRPPPELAAGEIAISVTISNRPTEQYEQVDLVWYYDDSNMVKIGEELVDGKLSIVMGREENDRTRTLAIIPLNSFVVQVRHVVKGSHLRGEFRVPGEESWKLAGECTVPAPPGKEPKLSLQCYQGPAKEEHWARLTDFKIIRLH